ncbi:MAG TPA: hypothetical protein VFI29_13585 [Hanamia sp.]|nr:hypothetical protein [Hanamia sp.]
MPRDCHPEGRSGPHDFTKPIMTLQTSRNDGKNDEVAGCTSPLSCHSEFVEEGEGVRLYWPRKASVPTGQDENPPYMSVYCFYKEPSAKTKVTNNDRFGDQWKKNDPCAELWYRKKPVKTRV